MLDIAMVANEKKAKWDSFHFLDDIIPEGSKVSDIEIMTFNDLLALYRDKKKFEICIANGQPLARRKILEKLKHNDLERFLTQVVSPDARVSKNATLGAGVIICPGSHISVDARIGSNSVVNCNSIVGHDVEIGENTVISSQVNIGGKARIADNVFIGMGTQIRDGLSVGSNSIISMASALYRDAPANFLLIGNPAKVARRIEDVKLYNNQ